ncbi:hypothetical protein [Brevundimonas sp.]|jgi:hypothetical protein|uniref:hypothetical protein n=1 Tax=Brevundimonas sp. TaxID=1871086 RepID=UPI0035B2240F
MLLASLLTVAVLADPDGVVATAPAGALDLASAAAAPVPVAAPSPTAQDAAPHGMTTEEQIQRWIAARERGQSFEEAVAAAPADDRQMHGMVEAGIGTGGYRSYGAAVSLPVGENGRLDLAYREGRNEPWSWGGYPGAYGPGYGLGRYPRFNGGDTRSLSMGFSWSKDDGDRDDWPTSRRPGGLIGD